MGSRQPAHRSALTVKPSPVTAVVVVVAGAAADAGHDVTKSPGDAAVVSSAISAGNVNTVNHNTTIA